MSSLRVLDPAGVAQEWLAAQLPEVEIHRTPDGEHPYDAGLLYADLDNRVSPAERLAAIAQDIKRPGGRIYVSVPNGTQSGRMSVRTPGRRRAWHSIDVADLLRRFGVMQDFGVDEEGWISASVEPRAKGAEVAVWTGYAIGPWSPLDIASRGLGGSETAAYRISEALADMGYVVTLYGQFTQEGAVKDVITRDWRKFDPTTPRKAVITFRDATMYDAPVNAETKILWLEDVAGAEQLNEQRAEQIDYICGVSDWHKRNVEEVYPWLAPEKVIASRNGITHSYFEGEAPEREPRLLYTSSPDRGLHIVLECWPEIKARVPDASLYHCYGPWYDMVANVRPDAAEYRARCRQMTEDFEDVKAVGPLGQKDLAMLMRSSRVHAMPSWFMEYSEFSETCGISVLEAQAAGLYCVTSDRGALKENNMTGVQIPGDPLTPEWRERFIEEVVKGLTDPETQHRVEAEGPAAVADRDWSSICEQLQGLWEHQRPAEIEPVLMAAA